MRGGEAADLLQALNTGHGGSLTTVHSNNADVGLSLAWLVVRCKPAESFPWEATCRSVLDGIAMVIHMARRGRAETLCRGGPSLVNGYEAGWEPLAHHAGLGGSMSVGGHGGVLFTELPSARWLTILARR